ncbi:transcription factor sef1 [Colletotrichum tofieldiae]|uniref:Transcription factor sef1 n=1 Tax=Colletotrichum tofieldiae TaxID=708197 RepID=A0A166W6W1_9PEZI|nr:transcription factor sef1 [Colletotrichum tofieldiae]
MDVTFLRTISETTSDIESKDGVYSAQISCIVSGYDQWRWTAYFAIDTWFEEESDDPSLDKVIRYQNDEEDGLYTDPLSRGRTEASLSAWHPRVYFLRTMEIRLTQIKWTSDSGT